MVKRTTSTYDAIEKIFAQVPNKTKHRSLDPAYITAKGDGTKIVKAGSLISSIPGSTKCRIFPGGLLNAAIVASTTTELVLRKEAAKSLLPAEILYSEPYDALTFALVWADGDTASISTDGNVTFSYLVAGFTTLAALASTFAEKANASVLAPFYRFVADGEVVYAFKRGVVGGLYEGLSAGALTAGTGTFSEIYSSAEPTLVGTIAANGVNADTSTVTLAAATAISLPAGAGVHAVGHHPIGILDYDHDAIEAPNQHVSIADDGTLIDTSRLSYWDGQTAGLLPNLKTL